MALDPRTPVLVGGGQFSNRVDEGAEALEPVDLLAEAARRAAADTGAADAGKVLAAVDSVRVVQLLSWRYRDPGRLVAERIGASDVRHTLYTHAGGNTPQSLVNRTCLDIAGGRADVVLIGGAEAWRTRMSFKGLDARPPWTHQADDVAPTETFGGEFALDAMVHPAEMARGIVMPVQFYPMFESALRAEAGATHTEWAAHLGRLWSGFSAVAATNPNAWIQESFTAEELVAPSPTNRMIGFPYPKRLNSNNAVEQGGAVLLCSVDAAERLGIPRDAWVFPQAGTDAHDTAHVSSRGDLRSSPAIRVAGRRALELAGVGPDDIAHVDVYSCFPSAVQIAAKELGLGLDRQLTVTGGLSFAGGPWNNYVSHAIAAMVGVLREHPGDVGLVTANGGNITKHAFGLYATEPPAEGFRWDAPDAEVEAATSARLPADGAYAGPVSVEAYTVMHDRAGDAEVGLCALLTPAGERAWGRTDDDAALAAMVDTEVVGRDAELAGDGTVRF
ncbi:MAG: acetyl-CoA acetyltransferase [Acidimicrobiia bacterium]|nr:acetyl-CoA acetyltransferase [Acidimicrobiia bacterium]